ncbi:MAG: hypothetical protein JWM93_186 [Frankiales bacterium]|nr:hypothetical protein [Frankiales bacterium]
MHRTTTRVCIAVGLVSFMLTSAATGHANWTTNGSAMGTAWTASAGASKLAVTASGASGIQGITCTQASAVGDLVGPTLSSGAGISVIIPIFGGTCQAVGQTSAVKCSNPGPHLFNAQTYSAGTSTTTGSLTGIHCTVAKTSGACGNATTFNATGSATGAGIQITGSAAGFYGNTTQQFSVDTVGQALNVSWSSMGCLQGTGTGSAQGNFQNASGTALIYSMTSAFKPQITN